MTAVFVHTCNHDSAGRRPHCPTEGEEVDVHGVDNLLEEERDLHAEDLGRFLSQRTEWGGRSAGHLFPYLCADQKSQGDPDSDLYSQFALRCELSSVVLTI